jgi:hypothetical protein
MPQHVCDIAEAARDAEPLRQLTRHQRFPIACRHDLAVRNPMDRVYVLIRDLPASDDGDSKHCLPGNRDKL